MSLSDLGGKVKANIVKANVIREFSMTFLFATNASRGLAYLSKSYSLSNGNIERTLAGYNGGHRLIFQSHALWPEETVRYVTWGTALYQDTESGIKKSSTLEAWLNAGGNHLCEKAEISLGLE